jgi:hypothetical protein
MAYIIVAVVFLVVGAAGMALALRNNPAWYDKVRTFGK